MAVRKMMRAVFLAGLVFASAIGALGGAEEVSTGAVPEYVLKAGFLYNFAKYVTWPGSAFAEAGSPIAIGVVGVDPFGHDLENILGSKTVGGRSFTFRRFALPDEIERCHILFVARSEKDRVPEILKRIDAWPVLTVGESDGFSRQGGATNILIDQDRPRLEVNPEAAERVKLSIDAKLLRLAKIVRTETGR